MSHVFSSILILCPCCWCYLRGWGSLARGIMSLRMGFESSKPLFMSYLLSVLLMCGRRYDLLESHVSPCQYGLSHLNSNSKQTQLYKLPWSWYFVTAAEMTVLSAIILQKLLVYFSSYTKIENKTLCHIQVY